MSAINPNHFSGSVEHRPARCPRGDRKSHAELLEPKDGLQVITHGDRRRISSDAPERFSRGRRSFSKLCRPRSWRRSQAVTEPKEGKVSTAVRERIPANDSGARTYPAHRPVVFSQIAKGNDGESGGTARSWSVGIRTDEDMVIGQNISRPIQHNASASVRPRNAIAPKRDRHGDCRTHEIADKISLGLKRRRLRHRRNGAAAALMSTGGDDDGETRNKRQEAISHDYTAFLAKNRYHVVLPCTLAKICAGANPRKILQKSAFRDIM